MESERTIAEARHRRGVSDAALQEAIDVSDREASSDDADVYLSSLARFVGALGGHLEVRAVFPEEEIVVWREPDVDH
jgi:hypothetical protein